MQQSALWYLACRRLGVAATMEALGGGRAVVLRRRVPVLGDTGLLSRAPLDLSDHRAGLLRTGLGVRHLVVNAESEVQGQALAAAGFRRIGAPRIVVELALSPCSDIMAARLGAKWRNRLRHGQSHRLVIRRRPMPADPRHWLLRAEAQQARRLRYRPLPPDMVAALAASAPGAAQIFTAFHQGRRIAAMLFLHHGRDATYQIGWSDAQGRSLSAGPALIWRAMLDLQQIGVDRIDLGAADPSQNPGLARFKRGTGARTRSLGGTWLDSAWLRGTGRRANRRRAGARNPEAPPPIPATEPA